MGLSTLNPFSLPNDGPRWAALLLAACALAFLPWLLATRRRRHWAQALAPASAAALSAAYVVGYLRGGPRIIDATSYWLEARTLADGLLALPITTPEQSELGRFLLRTVSDGAPAASVIFPPGFPAVLALGFVVGAPLAVGPAIAAALVLATDALARRVGQTLDMSSDQVDSLATVAALLSVVCATLRYHTADTMSHGLAALCFTLGLWAALTCGGAPSAKMRWSAAAVGGAALGWALATRPATALALALSVAVLAAVGPRRELLRPRHLATAMVAASPGVALWLVYQHAATGSLTATAQQAYYALSDGPPGCFRYGFGDGIGCLGEHGAFVRARLGDGYGAWAALGTSARRLQMHLVDALGFAPSFGLVALAAWWHRRRPAVVLLATALVAQVACYAPFYFDGNYPGGGARMLADVLPLEHVLAAVALWSLRRISAPRAASICLALALAGFALHTGAHHSQLRDREGGRPMFEQGVAARAPRPALLFVDTDHGFNLARAAHIQVARFRGDDLDRLSWEARGRPLAFRYRFSWPAEGAAGKAWLEPLTFAPSPTDGLRLRIEGESCWPPASQRGGWAWPVFPPSACASGGRALAFYPSEAGSSLVLKLPAAALAGRNLAPVLVGVASPNGHGGWVTVGIHDDKQTVAEWRVALPEAWVCTSLPARPLPPDLSAATVTVEADDAVAIDLFELGEKR